MGIFFESKHVLQSSTTLKINLCHKREHVPQSIIQETLEQNLGGTPPIPYIDVIRPDYHLCKLPGPVPLSPRGLMAQGVRQRRQLPCLLLFPHLSHCLVLLRQHPPYCNPPPPPRPRHSIPNILTYPGSSHHSIRNPSEGEEGHGRLQTMCEKVGCCRIKFSSILQEGSPGEDYRGRE